MEWEFAISKIGQKELPLQPLKHRLKTTRIGILITRFGSPRFGGLIRRLSARSLTECGSGDLSRKCQENIEKTSRVSKREMRFVLLVRIISFRAPAIPFGQLLTNTLPSMTQLPCLHGLSPIVKMRVARVVAAKRIACFRRSSM